MVLRLLTACCSEGRLEHSTEKKAYTGLIEPARLRLRLRLHSMYLSCGCEILSHQPSTRDTPLEEQCTPHLPKGSQGVGAYRPQHCRDVAGGPQFSHFTCAMYRQQTHFLITATAADPVQRLSRSKLVSHLADKKKQSRSSVHRLQGWPRTRKLHSGCQPSIISEHLPSSLRAVCPAKHHFLRCCATTQSSIDPGSSQCF